MKKNVLYVSDLDGTLLDSKKRITPYTANVLNQCIQKGMKFAVATARMPYGCDYRLQEIEMDTPGIVTNGVFLYDFKEKKIISAEEIEKKSAEQVIKAFEKHGMSCFVYIFSEGSISLYYGDKTLEKQTQYYSDRALEACRKIVCTDHLQDAFQEGKVAYITYTGEKEKLEPVCRELDQIPDIDYSFYLNIYNDWYCLEIFSKKASKKNALLKLKEMIHCDEIVVFGDNFNDLSMIELSDRSYAPANALPEVKEQVTEVLDDCDHDGVAKFLEKEWELS